MAKIISVTAVSNGLTKLRVNIETSRVSSYVASREEEAWYLLAELHYPYLLKEILDGMVERISPGSHTCFYRRQKVEPFQPS